MDLLNTLGEAIAIARNVYPYCIISPPLIKSRVGALVLGVHMYFIDMHYKPTPSIRAVLMKLAHGLVIQSSHSLTLHSMASYCRLSEHTDKDWRLLSRL